VTRSGGRPGRSLAVAVIACAAGAAVALFALSRVWVTDVVSRPAPLPPQSVPHRGGALLPWVPALALVALAGAGAVVATRGRLRRIIGGLVVTVAAGLVAGGVVGLGRAAGGRVAWPALVALAGLAIGWAGVRVIRHGSAWPAMGTRYERARPRAARAATMWDDLDRGVDPTADSGYDR
jgi:Tryptophan-associated transmembrane protein (Trp_oprn_chp)